MLQEVALGSKSLADYTHLSGKGVVDEIRELAGPLEGKRVLHVSATAFGGGVSEILYTLVPLMRDVGLETSWQIIMGREEFFNATKLLHNSLQGDPNTLSPNQWELFDHYNKMNAESLEGEWDFVIVHDPQPVGMRKDAHDHGKHWIWRCHIDLSEPNPDPIERLLPLAALVTVLIGIPFSFSRFSSPRLKSGTSNGFTSVCFTRQMRPRQWPSVWSPMLEGDC